MYLLSYLLSSSTFPSTAPSPQIKKKARPLAVFGLPYVGQNVQHGQWDSRAVPTNHHGTPVVQCAQASGVGGGND